LGADVHELLLTDKTCLQGVGGARNPFNGKGFLSVGMALESRDNGEGPRGALWRAKEVAIAGLEAI
jgi:hypothetical protein